MSLAHRNYLKISILLLFLLISSGGTSVMAASGEGEEFNPGEMIMHHVIDAHEWHFFDWGETHVTLPLPIILYSKQNGLVTFLSSNFHHGETSYKGYKMDSSGHIVSEDGHSFLDLSITKNTAALFMSAIIMLVVFIAMAKRYRSQPGKAPGGLQSWLEPVVLYVKDEIVKPSIGPKYERYLPYMLTLFFFIWMGNLLGLLPGAANLTGNIAVTLVLAIFTLIMTLYSANKNYWMHILNPPGVPVFLKPVIAIIEVIGIFTKPFSLMLRLFVAITAGHIVILSLIGLAFIFKSMTIGFGTSFVIVFISLIELLVAAIQAYVFTLFSSIYIGMAVAEDHH
ncbi:MAG: F0F1 ATP synthase subunit A [Cyclobacteriaceae bacterium]